MGINWFAKGSALVQSPISLTLCTTQAGFESVLRAFKIPLAEGGEYVSPSASATTHFLRHRDEPGAVIVCVPPPEEGQDGITVACLIAHEAAHAWRAMREHIGEDSPSSEFEAYSMQSIMNFLLREYHHQVFKPQKRKRHGR